MKLYKLGILALGLGVASSGLADQFNNWGGDLAGSAVDLAHQQSVINSNYSATVDNDLRIHNNGLTVSGGPDYFANMGTVSITNSVNDNFTNGAANNNGGTFQGVDNTYRIDVANVAQNSVAPVNAYSTNLAPVNQIIVGDIDTSHNDQFFAP